MILLFEPTDSGSSEGDTGGRTDNKVFAPSVGDTSGSGKIAEAALSGGVAIGGKYGEDIGGVLRGGAHATPQCFFVHGSPSTDENFDLFRSLEPTGR